MRTAIPLIFILLATTACGSRGDGPPGRFGEVTSAVVIVNPVINQGSTTTTNPGPNRAEVPFDVTGVGRVWTNDTGLALVEDLPTGEIVLDFDPGEVTFNVAQPLELYDVVVAVNAQGANHVLPPVRYPIGGEVVHLRAGGDIPAAAREDGTIVFLEPGTYPGGFEIRAQNVLVFGAWSAEDGPLSILEGDVTVRGGNGRFRGLRIEGRITSAANGFSMAFSDVDSANITGNGVTLIRNRFIDGGATVPSSNAVLVDNEGIP